MLCLPFFLYFFLNVQACESWKVEEQASQPACLGYKSLSRLYLGALQACVKARQIPGAWFVFSFPSPRARGSYRHGAIVNFRRIQDTYFCSSVVCQLLLARVFSVGLPWGGMCVCVVLPVSAGNRGVDVRTALRLLLAAFSVLSFLGCPQPLLSFSMGLQK